MPYNADQGTLRLLKRSYAERTRRTIFFVGAGASVEAGLPSWFQLREAVHLEIDKIVSAEELDQFRELETYRNSNDYWSFFECAEKNWPITYTDAIASKLEIDYAAIPVPVIYKKLWSMRNVRQVATLNVDGLIEVAFQHEERTHKGKLLAYDGYNVTDSQSFIAKDSFCVLNLHGTVYQKSRWIMNGAERRRLTNGESGKQYASFLTWLFQSHNIVFIGVNPMDMAISPAVRAAKDSNILGSHFWICPSPNQETRKWAQDHRVRLITYEPESLSDGVTVHSSTICSILDDIEQYVSPDAEVQLPNSRDEYDLSALPSSGELVKMLSSDRARAIRMMSGVVTRLGNKYGHSSPQIRQFINDLSLPIQFATALDAKSFPYNTLERYKLNSRIHGGGSSTVWLCEDPENPSKYFVAKILNGNNHADDTERQSFRRGIESLFLLKETNLPVSPQYIDHLELPLTVIMEHISGSTLADVVESGLELQHDDVVKLFLLLVRTVRCCHMADGQVLHRDLKPRNIIFEGWYPGYEKSDLLDSNPRLINFDLSWHRYSHGNTKAVTADEAGYYAPEQKGLRNSAPPRSAETDAYMLGMVLFYLICGQNPPEGGAKLVDWENQVLTMVKRQFKGNFLVNRVSRMIKMMTLVDMSSRMDLEAAISEAESVLAFMQGRLQSVDHDFFVENLIASTDRQYIWNSDRLEGKVQTIVSADFRFRYVSKGMKCEIEFSRSRGDDDARATFGGKINDRIRDAMQTLSDAGWEVETGGGVIKSLRASIRIHALIKKADLGMKEVLTISNRLLTAIE